MSSHTIGVIPPPPGIVPNFNNPESIASHLILPSVLGAAIAIPVCSIRLYTKRSILKLVSYDDYAIVVATILALGFSILTSYQTTNGLGILYLWDFPAHKYFKFLKIGSIAGPIFYNLSTLFTKISLSLWYLRLLQFLSFRIAVYAVMVVSILYTVAPVTGSMWLCRPMTKLWDPTVATGSCIDFNVFFLAIGCLNTVTDLTLLILPVLILWNMRLPLPRKIGAALLLMAGSFVVVASLIRVRIIIKGMQKTAGDGTTRAMVANFMWMLIEMWLGIICACLSSLYTFFRKRFPAIHKRSVHRRSGKPSFPEVPAGHSESSDQIVFTDLP